MSLITVERKILEKNDEIANINREEMKVVIISTTEGDDKPLKYPAIFRNSEVLVINKIDLLPHVNCDVDTIIKNAHSINSGLKVFEVSCTSMEGINEWCEFLLYEVKSQ